MAADFSRAEFVLSAVTPAAFLRDGLPQVAFAGRSNVGKSSVINRITGRKNFARVGASPGKTSQINYFRIQDRGYLVDLPGYGYAKVSKAERDRWGRLMEDYFASGLITWGVMIVDARHSRWRLVSVTHPTQAHTRRRDHGQLVFSDRLSSDPGGQQAGQAEKVGDRAQPGPHQGDLVPPGGGSADPLLRRAGRRQGGAALRPWPGHGGGRPSMIACPGQPA